MNYTDVMNTIIDKGIEAAKVDYAAEADAEKLRGALAGLESCRRKNPTALRALHRATATDPSRRFVRRTYADHNYKRARFLEIDWVCRVVSALLVQEGKQPFVEVDEETASFVRGFVPDALIH